MSKVGYRVEVPGIEWGKVVYRNLDYGMGEREKRVFTADELNALCNKGDFKYFRVTTIELDETDYSRGYRHGWKDGQAMMRRDQNEAAT